MGTHPDEQLHTSTLISPASERRRDRRARARASARLRTEDDRARADVSDAERQARRAEDHQTQYLPAGGERQRESLRTLARFRVPAHLDTTAAVQGTFPFLAGAGLGAEGVFIGQDLVSGSSFAFDPWSLYRQGVITAPNVILAGLVGVGKSALAKSLYTRSLAFGRRVYVAADVKGEHTAIARMVGGQAIVLGHGLSARLNPLDEGYRRAGIAEQEWAAQLTSRRRDLVGALTESVLGRALTPVEHTAIDVALRSTVAASTVPVLPMVVDRILEPGPGEDSRLAEDGRHAGHALRRLVRGDLGGLFDGPSTVPFDPTAPMVSLDLSRVADNDALIGVLMTCASAWMEAALLDPAGGQRWVVYDEAWRLLSSPPLLRRMDSQFRLSRHFGIANLVILHRLSDLDTVGDSGTAMRSVAASVLSNAETRIVYRQESDELSATAALLGLTGTERRILPTLSTGQGLWRIKDSAFIVQHQLHPEELRAFDTTQKMTQVNPREFTIPEAE